MQKVITVFLLFSILTINAQTPKLYVNIVSHNEMTTTGPYAEPYDTNPAFFQATADTARKIADMVYAKGAKWNLETCQKFVFASLAQESAATSTVDVLEYCNKKGGSSGAYIEIDPRYKTSSPTYTLDIADVAHMIDSTGALASHNLGGFLCWTQSATPNPFTGQDWTLYQNVNYPGAKFHKPWKAQVLWGPGSSPPHKHDANNYGIWQPTNANDSIGFYSHTASATNAWLQGNGCSPQIPDSNVSVQWIVNYFKDITNKLQSGAYPSNKFYVASIMTNFKHYSSPNYRQRLTTVVDSLNTMLGTIVWATISQKQAAFNNWRTANSIDYSQWNCGQSPIVTGMQEKTDSKINIYPNPVNNEINISGLYGKSIKTVSIYNLIGHLVKEITITGNEYERINVAELKPGYYILSVGNQKVKIIKE